MYTVGSLVCSYGLTFVGLVPFVPLVVFSRKSAIELAGSLASPGPSRHDCARHDICAFEVRLSMGHTRLRFSKRCKKRLQGSFVSEQHFLLRRGFKMGGGVNKGCKTRLFSLSHTRLSQALSSFAVCNGRMLTLASILSLQYHSSGLTPRH